MELKITSDKEVLQKYNKKSQEMLKEYKKENDCLLITLVKKIAHHYNGYNAKWNKVGDKKLQKYLRTQT